VKASCDINVVIVENLTAQQKKLLEMLLKGISPKEIAFNINISYNTFLYHQKQLYRKLNVHSVQELFAKYATEVNNEAVNGTAPEGENNVRKNALFGKWQFLLLGILTVAVVLLFILMFTRKPVAPPVENGHVVKTCNYDKIYLQVNRWGIPSDKPNNYYGEQLADVSRSVKLLDFCSFADIKDKMKIKISGTIDKDIDLSVRIYRVSINNEWTWIGSNYIPFPKVKSGFFEKTVEINFPDSDPLNNDALGELIVQILQPLWMKNGDTYDGYNFGSIPANIPNGTIMATISNVTIGLVDD